MILDEDNLCIEEIKKGNISAYNKLIIKHEKLAFNIAYKITKNREDSEEICQDAFLKAYKNISFFNGDSKFSTWLYRIIYNTAISKTRKKKIDINTSKEENLLINITDTKNATIDLEKNERKKFINHALEKLPAEENILINLFYIKEKSIDEIAIITSLSKSNVKVKLYRARKKIYSELEKILKTELKTIL